MVETLLQLRVVVRALVASASVSIHGVGGFQTEHGSLEADEEELEEVG